MDTKLATRILAGSRDVVEGVSEDTIQEALSVIRLLRRSDATRWSNNHNLLTKAYQILGAPYPDGTEEGWESMPGVAWHSGCHPIQRVDL